MAPVGSLHASRHQAAVEHEEGWTGRWERRSRGENVKEKKRSPRQRLQIIEIIVSAQSERDTRGGLKEREA